MRPTVTPRSAVFASIVIALSLALVGCGGSSGGHAAGTAAQSPKTTSASGSTSTSPCTLLTDDEVTGVIGAHSKGATGILTGGLYGDDSCVWKSTAAPGGRADTVEVAALSGTTASEARAQEADEAPALASFGHNAHYDTSYSRLWFDCGKNELCHVRVDTASETTRSGDSRQAAAVKLGQLLLNRV